MLVNKLMLRNQITLNPPVGESYVFRQVCENDPHRKDKDKVSKTNQ